MQNDSAITAQPSIKLAEVRSVVDPAFVRWLRETLGLPTPSCLDATICDAPVYVSPFIDPYGLAGYTILVEADHVLMLVDFHYPRRQATVVSPVFRRWTENANIDEWQAVVMFLWDAGLKTDTARWLRCGGQLVDPIHSTLIEHWPKIQHLFVDASAANAAK